MRFTSSLWFSIAIAWPLLLTSGTVARPAEGKEPVRSPYAAVQAIALDEVEWTKGFWADRIEIVHKRSIPAMWEIMKGTKYKPFYQNFLVAAGQVEGDYHGAQWNDGDFYKFLEAVCAISAIS